MINLPVLLDTKALWGLLVRCSAYSAHVYEIAREHTLLIPLPAVIEAWMAIYKVFSSKGQNLSAGLKALVEAQRKLEAIIERPEDFGLSVRLVALSFDDLKRTFSIITEHPDLFIKEGPRKTKWVRFFDAIIATLWERTKAILLTDDEELLEFGKRKGLPSIRLEKRGKACP